MNKIIVKNTKDCVKDAIKKQIISNKDELLKDLETMDKNTVVVKVFDSIRYYNLPTKTRNALTDKINESLNLAVTIDEDLYEELEEILIMADIGMDTTMEIIERLMEIYHSIEINQ